MDKWLHVNVLDKSVICLKLAENEKISFDEKYLVKKISLEVPTSKSASIVFDICIRDSHEISSKLLHKTNITIKKNRTFLQIIDNIINSFCAYQTLPIDFIITKTSNGVNIGVMSPKYEAKHIALDIASISRNSTKESEIIKIVEAKELFISNIKSFVPAIENTFLKKGIDIEVQNNDWVNAISQIPNSTSLLAIYNTCEKDMGLWVNILESWGIKVDKCKRYPYLAINQMFYNIPSNIPENSILEVITPSLTIWTEAIRGQKEEKVIIKGNVKICQN